jgi:hypothetical protein
MKSLRFPVKGVSGLSLIFSEALVVMVADVSAMVSISVSSFVVVSKFLCWYWLCQSFVSRCRGIRCVVESKSRGIGLSWCQGVGVRCKDTGAFVGETTLLLDFGTLRQNVRQSELKCSLPRGLQEMRRKELCILSERLQSVV